MEWRMLLQSEVAKVSNQECNASCFQP